MILSGSPSRDRIHVNIYEKTNVFKDYKYFS